MYIWIFQTGEPLPVKSGVRKMRTALLANTLIDRKHKVLWWTSAFEHQQKLMIANKDVSLKISKRYTIRALHGIGYKNNVSIMRYIDHQILALKFRLQANRFPKPDCMVISTPDYLLGYEATRYAIINRIPFIVDIRDLWPDVFLEHFRNGKFFHIIKLLLFTDFLRLKYMINNAKSIVAVSEEYLRWGLEKIDRSATIYDKVIYIGYKKNKVFESKHYKKNNEMPCWIKEREKQKIFIFIGTFGLSYELELIVDVAEKIYKSGNMDICFIIAGTGDKFENIQRKASRLENVVLPGWINEKEINALLMVAYAGLLSYKKDASQGLPNKPFEYLSAGLPLINSLEGEMAELINRYNLGINYSPGDANGLMKCIEKLSNDSELYNLFSKNAYKFFLEYGNAEKLYNMYSEHIENIIEK